MVKSCSTVHCNERMFVANHNRRSMSLVLKTAPPQGFHESRPCVCKASHEAHSRTRYSERRLHAQVTKAARDQKDCTEGSAMRDDSPVKPKTRESESLRWRSHKPKFQAVSNMDGKALVMQLGSTPAFTAASIRERCLELITESCMKMATLNQIVASHKPTCGGLCWRHPAPSTQHKKRNVGKTTIAPSALATRSSSHEKIPIPRDGSETMDAVGGFMLDDDVLTELIDDDGLFDMSDATSSASESSVDRAPPVKKKQKPGRKPVGRQVAKRGVTYYKRKDEIQELQDQVKELQAKLEQAEQNAPLARLNAAAAMNTMLSSGLEHNHLVFAGTESMMSNYKHTMGSANAATPLNTYIHLPVDKQRRAQILGSMREAKLQEAFRFMAERTRFVDLNVKQGQNEHFDLPNGDMALIGFDVVQFRSGHNVRQVYEALQAFSNTQEMCVSEKLGILTVRESDEVPEFTFCESRFLSTIPEGLEVESNGALFGGFFEPTETSPGFAIAAMDYIDQDDLHPNRPEFCGRKEVVGAILLSEVPSETGRVVAMTRWSNVRFRPPSTALLPHLETAARERFMGWCQLMPVAMQQWLDTRPPA